MEILKVNTQLPTSMNSEEAFLELVCGMFEEQRVKILN